MTSIRGRLLIILLILFGLGWLVLAGLTYNSTRHETEELFDAQLAQSARVLLSLSVHELEEEVPEQLEQAIIGLKPGHAYEEKLAFQIWKQDTLFLRSSNAPAAHMTGTIGYSDQTIGGNLWRVFSLTEKDRGITIEVGERYELRNELIYKILLDTLLPILLTFPVLALLLWTGINRGLAPMKRIASEIARRSPQQLEPLNGRDGEVPEEIRPLTTSLNNLLARLKEALDSERRFTANASHELRTPLAGLKTQAQVALRATTSAERKHALEQIIRGVDRATHLVTQLLTLARLDPDVAISSYEQIDLVKLCSAIQSDLAPFAQEKQIELKLEENGQGQIMGNESALTIMLRNLVDNAIRYTPERGRIAVCVAPTADSVELTITDTGPGIPQVERVNVFDRFYRAPGNNASGCGLGLSIARRVAEMHGTRIELDTPASGEGLLVRIRFPAVPAGNKDESKIEPLSI